jgi:hypothetical protein
MYLFKHKFLSPGLHCVPTPSQVEAGLYRNLDLLKTMTVFGEDAAKVIFDDAKRIWDGDDFHQTNKMEFSSRW